MVPNDEKGAIHLTLDCSPELLCFTMELSSDLGKPKILHKAMEGSDTQWWKDAIANQIKNFI